MFFVAFKRKATLTLSSQVCSLEIKNLNVKVLHCIFCNIYSFLALAVFDTVVALTVILLKGLPNVSESSYHVDVFPVAHPLLSCSYVTSIYLTVLMTLERFHAICLKGIAKKQNNQKLIIFILILIFAFASIFNIPKFLEYTLKDSDVRTSYDIKDKIWTEQLKKVNVNPYKTFYNLDNNDHLSLMQNYRDNMESGAFECTYFSNFSCMFLNPNNFFQFEF